MIKWVMDLWRLIFAPVGQRQQQSLGQFDARVRRRLRGIEHDTVKLIAKGKHDGE